MESRRNFHEPSITTKRAPQVTIDNIRHSVCDQLDHRVVLYTFQSFGVKGRELCRPENIYVQKLFRYVYPSVQSANRKFQVKSDFKETG